MDDWKPGDLALCVRGGPWDSMCATIDGFPVSGRLYCVAKLGLYKFKDGVCRALWFDDAPRNARGQRVWGECRFRKVTPPEADAFDREVIEQMTAQPATAEGVGS